MPFFDIATAAPEIARTKVFLSQMAMMEFREAEKFLKGEDGMGDGPLDPNVKYVHFFWSIPAGKFSWRRLDVGRCK